MILLHILKVYIEKAYILDNNVYYDLLKKIIMINTPKNLNNLLIQLIEMILIIII